MTYFLDTPYSLMIKLWTEINYWLIKYYNKVWNANHAVYNKYKLPLYMLIYYLDFTDTKVNLFWIETPPNYFDINCDRNVTVTVTLLHIAVPCQRKKNLITYSEKYFKLS